MIIFMSDIICITARNLCCRDFLQQLGLIANGAPRAVILREKDLTEVEYRELAEKTIDVFKESNTRLILHNFYKPAIDMEWKFIHLPLHVLREISGEDKKHFKNIGTSCHSVADALEAVRLGADYITAGHVFATDCKKDLEPRGLAFLRAVCTSVDIPVYAIGGITPYNIGEVMAAGASGACVMSGLMKCDDPAEYIREFEKK